MIVSRRTARPVVRVFAPTSLPRVGAALFCFPTMLAATAASATTPCFAEIEQDYAWDDGGFTIRGMPKCFGDPGSKELHKIGCSTHVLASLTKERVVEERYGWRAIRCAGRCAKRSRPRPPFFRAEIRYELRVFDGKPPRRTQRTVSAGAVIPGVGGPTTVPSDGNPYIARLGRDPIAGQPCERTMMKSPVSGGAVTTMCVFVVPRSCKLAPLVQVLDLQTSVAGAPPNHVRFINAAE